MHLVPSYFSNAENRDRRSSQSMTLISGHSVRDMIRDEGLPFCRLLAWPQGLSSVHCTRTKRCEDIMHISETQRTRGGAIAAPGAACLHVWRRRGLPAGAVIRVCPC